MKCFSMKLNADISTTVTDEAYLNKMIIASHFIESNHAMSNPLSVQKQDHPNAIFS